MSMTRLARVSLLGLMLAPALAAQAPITSEPVRYMLPPKNIVDVFDAESLPGSMLSPNKEVMALTSARAHPAIAELSQPMLRLAGSRINPKTNGPRLGGGIYAITLKNINTAAETKV